MNIMVHRREEHLIEGVVLTFVNIDAQKRAQQKIEEMRYREIQSSKRFAESIVETVGEALLVLDEQMRVVTANRRFFDHFDTNREETEGKSLFELGNGQWNIPELRRLLEETAEQRKAIRGLSGRAPVYEDRFKKNAAERPPSARGGPGSEQNPAGHRGCDRLSLANDH